MVDGCIAEEPAFERKRGGLLEPLGAEVLNETQEPERFADHLPGMALAAQLSFEDLACRRSHPLGTNEQLIDAPFPVGAVLRRPMRLDGQTLITASGARMGGDEAAALEDLNRLGGKAR